MGQLKSQVTANDDNDEVVIDERFYDFFARGGMVRTGSAKMEIQIEKAVARLVGVGQCGARRLGAESHVVELGTERTQARFDVAEALAVGQLGKRHA